MGHGAGEGAKRLARESGGRLLAVAGQAPNPSPSLQHLAGRMRIRAHGHITQERMVRDNAKRTVFRLTRASQSSVIAGANQPM